MFKFFKSSNKTKDKNVMDIWESKQMVKDFLEHPFAFGYVEVGKDEHMMPVISIKPHTLCKTEDDARQIMKDEKEYLYHTMSDLKKLHDKINKMCVIKMIK